MTISKVQKKQTDMTSGPIIPLLLKFALPLVAGHLFQQLYNMVDSIVVGNFVGVQAQAAVGSTGWIVNTFVGFFMGFANGAGVIISQHYGAKEEKRIHAAVHTAISLALIFGVVVMVVGNLLAPAMLKLMDTPDDVYPDALSYLRIYFLGATGLLIYNLGAGILQSVGDSKRPLYFLVLSSVVNTVLDLVFVLCFHWGVEGVAVATIIAQFVSAGAVLVTLCRSSDSYRLNLKELYIDRVVVRGMVEIGLPTGIHSMLTSFSNIFVQSYINRFQSACMAGWANYRKVESLLGLPASCIGMAVTTFAGQNVGVGNMKRAKKGAIIAMWLTCCAFAVCLAVSLVFVYPINRLFSPDAEVIEYGVMFVRWVGTLFIGFVPNQIFSGTMRGAGNTKIPTVMQFAGQIAIRQVYLFVVSRLTDSALLIGMSFPVGWISTSLLVSLYYFFGNWEKSRVQITAVGTGHN